mgnify:CR=1 FL=1
MATKIRLQRNGRKSYAFYSIVIADVRAPRDGKFTEKIGTYNPNTNPATVDLNFERALHWVMCGAQPTDTVRNILQSSSLQIASRVEKRIALALPVFRIERFAGVIPIRSAKSPKVIFLFAIITSKFTIIAISYPLIFVNYDIMISTTRISRCLPSWNTQTPIQAINTGSR